MVFCQCGTKMYVPSNTPKYVCYSCRIKIPIIDLENVFRDELKGYFVNSKNVAEYVNGANRAVGDKSQLFASLKSEQGRVKEEIESTFRLYHSGGLSADQFRVRFAPLDQRQKEIEAELPRLEGELAYLKIDGLSAEQITAEASDFYDRWPKMIPEQKRSYVESLVKTIVVSKDEVAINLCYLPSFENMAESQRRVPVMSMPSSNSSA